MNRRGFSLPSLALTAAVTLIVILVSPFLFEVLGVANLSGVEGFFAKALPFVLLWSALRVGSGRVVGA